MAVFNHTTTTTADAASGWHPDFDYSGANREAVTVTVPAAGGPFITADGETLEADVTVLLIRAADGTSGATFDAAECLLHNYVGLSATPMGSAVASSMTGELVFSVAESPPNHLYEMNGQTISGGVAMYPGLVAQWPAWVSGADISLPDWRGRALMAAGALGITGAVGSTYADATAKNGLRINRTYVQSDWNGQQDSDVSKGSNSAPGRRIDGTPLSSSDAYTRPNAVGLVLCIRAEGAVDITNGDGTAGQTLVSNGDGSATWS